jgi:pseudouridine synthase
LHVILARAGIASRRHAEELIRGGEVTVNGKVVSKLGSRANPERDHIKVSGKLIQRATRHEYYAFHKPVGVITTLSDPQGRPNVGEVVERLGRRLYPVGRLDFHSSGLLLLTNDGDLCARLTHPKSHVEKRYVAKLSGVPTEESIDRLRKGVDLSDGRTQPAYVRLQRTAANKAWLELRITEGRNRQVRRMLEAVGLRVEKLRRTAMGPIHLGDLPSGHVRRLSTEELSSLRAAAQSAQTKN